ncbi:MAG: SIMPL domain-containing protein [Spirochaetota bacterium]
MGYGSQQVKQSITNPHGITVLGSSSIKVEPDLALLQCKIEAKHRQAEKSIELLKEKINHMKTILEQFGVGSEDVQVSRFNVDKETSLLMDSFGTVTTMNICIRNLTFTEKVVTSLVENKARIASQIDYGASTLYKHRCEARKNAIVAAHEKASLYADAAKVELDKPIHIEDLPPNMVEDSQTQERIDSYTGRYVEYEVPMMVDGENVRLMNPSWILVNAAVMVTFAIK